MSMSLFAESERCVVPEFREGLLKWVGNKQKMAHLIAAHFPKAFGTYYEPFLGSGGVLGTLAPERAFASDVFSPLVEIWETLAQNPSLIKLWYTERWEAFVSGNGREVYENIRDSYNRQPNGADLLFLCRSCYGGIVRFRKFDGYMSTPCGVHKPMPPVSFGARVDEWATRLRGTEFAHLNYLDAMKLANPGDLIYCDPPYIDSQSILYGAQTFEIAELLEEIARCKRRGVFVALSIDGTKKSGKKKVEFPSPAGLFETETMIDCGKSMLRRFQRRGEVLDDDIVADRLLLTYSLD